MKISAKVIVAVSVVAIIELVGLYYFIANYHPDSTPAPAYNPKIVKYTQEEMVSLALNNETVKKYTSHLKYNISEVYESIDYLRIDLGNDTTYWVSLSVGFDPTEKKVDYVHLSGVQSFNLIDGGAVKPALFNETVKRYVDNKTYVVAEVNRPQQYILFYIGDMIWSCDRLKVGMDFKNDTVTYVTDLGPMALVLPNKNNTSAKVTSKSNG